MKNIILCNLPPDNVKIQRLTNGVVLVTLLRNIRPKQLTNGIHYFIADLSMIKLPPSECLYLNDHELRNKILSNLNFYWELGIVNE